MPYWEVFTPENALSDGDKEGLSECITQMYVDWVELPRFYVVMRFQEVPESAIYVGGKPNNNFVRVVIDDITLRTDDPELRSLYLATIESHLAPLVKDQGYDWEVHLDETPRDLWRIRGLIPPAPLSPFEKLWAQANQALPYDLASPVAE